MTTQTIRNPWSGDSIGDVNLASASDAEAAAERSRVSFGQTRKLASYERRDILRKIANGIDSRRDEFVRTIVSEAGKPKRFASAEVSRAIATFGAAAEEATRSTGEIISLDVTPESKVYEGEWSRVPIGPVLAICPFNFPLNLVAHKVAPALACGASVVVKPAPQTPLTALLLEAVVRESGAPEFAMQVLPCDNAVAESLVTSPVFKIFSFTGSAAVGWDLKAKSGKKKVLLELGGNAACVVHEDAGDLDAIASRLIPSAFGYAGQVCIKTQRVYVHRPIADAFIEKIHRATAALRVGDPSSDDTIVGPVIDEKSAVRIESWVDEAVASGHTKLVGGGRNGNRYEPTLLCIHGDGEGLRVVDEEIFGPVLTLHTYETWEEAIARVNAGLYGLQAGIFTDSHTRIRQAYRELEVGGVVVNDVPSVRVDVMPYGGVKDSGQGREGIRFAIADFTEPKVLISRRG